MLDLSKLLSGIFHAHAKIPQIIWRDGRAFQPVHLFCEVTYKCNLRCNFCQYLDIIEGKTKHVGPTQAEYTTEELCRKIDEFPYGRLISFAGGETNMRKDFPEILAHASRRHRTHIVTNGSLITEEIAKQYIDLAPRHIWQNGLVLVGVSMEGDQEQHDRIVARPGSWQRTVDAVRRMVRLRDERGIKHPKFNLKMVVTQDTVHGLVDFVELALELGVDIINFLAEHDLIPHSQNLTNNEGMANLKEQQPKPRGVDVGLLRDQLLRAFELAEANGKQIRLTPHVPIEEFIRHYTDDRALDPEQYRCGAVWSRLGISADGRYSPACTYLRTGNVREESISDVWNGPETRALRQEIMRSRVFAGCNGCCNLEYVGPRKFGLEGVDAETATPASS